MEPIRPPAPRLFSRRLNEILTILQIVLGSSLLIQIRASGHDQRTAPPAIRRVESVAKFVVDNQRDLRRAAAAADQGWEWVACGTRRRRKIPPVGVARVN